MEKGTQEWFDTRSEMEQRDQEHRIYLHQYYAELLSHYQEQWGKADLKEQERIAMKGIEELYDKRLIKWQEYQEARAAIALQYRKEQSEQDVGHSDGMWFHQRSEDAYQTASNNANADYQNEHPFGMGVKDWATADVKIYASTLANLKKMEQEGVITHEEAMAAMGRATAEMAAGIASKMQAAYDAVSPIMDAMSSYYSAQSDYEVTVTEKSMRSSSTLLATTRQRRKNWRRRRRKRLRPSRRSMHESKARCRWHRPLHRRPYRPSAHTARPWRAYHTLPTWYWHPLQRDWPWQLVPYRLPPSRSSNRLKRQATMRVASREDAVTADGRGWSMRASSWPTTPP